MLLKQKAQVQLQPCNQKLLILNTTISEDNNLPQILVFYCLGEQLDHGKIELRLTFYASPK